jgi:hypothetical protein
MGLVVERLQTLSQVSPLADIEPESREAAFFFAAMVFWLLAC